MGPVLPAFDCRLQANHRSSLRDDLALYDIILFIALGFSIDQARTFFRLHAGVELPRSTLQGWLDREHICWPPTNYSLESRCRFFQNHCAELPPPQRRLARAQQCRVDLMQRWLEGKVTAQQAAEEESLIQQALAQPAA